MGTMLYKIISFIAVYILLVLAVYSLSAVLNLFHLKRKETQITLLYWGQELLEAGLRRYLQHGLKKE